MHWAHVPLAAVGARRGAMADSSGPGGGSLSPWPLGTTFLLITLFEVLLILTEASLSPTWSWA